MKTVELFVYDQAAGLDVMGPMEVFSGATMLLRSKGLPGGYQLSLSAPESGAVTLTTGARLEVPIRLGDQTHSDYLMVVGGLSSEKFAADKALMARLSERVNGSSTLISVCTGAFLLAAVGALDGRNCTTHWRLAQTLEQQYPKLNVSHDAIYIQDGHVYTSAGVTAGIDLALALVEQDYGAELALEVARDLVLYLRRPGSQSQFSGPLELRQKVGDQFQPLFEWLQENIDAVLSVELMADFCNMSPRNFARRFVEQTGVTPAKYLEQMRMARARELLESTSMTVEAVAMESGFGREERLRRSFLKLLGVTPSIYRQHFGFAA